MMDGTIYQIEERKFSLDQGNSDEILKDAHRKKSRINCLCSENKPEMYVAKFQDSYILKRMPGTGHLHDPSCQTFDPPLELSGLGYVHGSAIINDENGGVFLKFDFPLTARGGPSQSKRKAAADDEAASAQDEDEDSEDPDTIKVPDRKLSLLGALHYLWDAAELTKHRPSWTGKRDWFLVRRELLSVVNRSSMKAKSLSSVLFIPECFRSERKDEIAAARNAFLANLAPQSGKAAPLGIVIGMYKSLDEAMIGERLLIKHMPDYSFYMDEKSGETFRKLYDDRIRTVDTVNGHFIVIATFAPKGKYGLIREVSGMPVNSQWIPFETDEELDALDAVTDRSFVKCLRYNLSKKAQIANFLLVDTDPPTSIYTPSLRSTDPYAERYLKNAQEGVYPARVWWPDDAGSKHLPPLKGQAE